jgi:biopolymer transport protein ExbD
MNRRHHYRRHLDEAPQLDMTTFLNLMVALVPFLLITAVFSRITIVELSLPSSAGGAAPTPPSWRMEVVVRDAGLEITNGSSVIATLPKLADGAYDLPRLGEMVLALKRQHPSKREASVLMEPLIEYDHLIQVMDVLRSAPDPDADAHAAPDAESMEPRRIALFPSISIGDAP